MSEMKYTVVEHDGGWAYRAAGVFSETFPTHEAAHAAAEAAARRQARPGEDQEISYEGSDGRWREEFSQGSDRPATEVDG